MQIHLVLYYRDYSDYILFTKQWGLWCVKSVDFLHELAERTKETMYTHKEEIIGGGFARAVLKQNA
jgi:hypothetical protein